jgi:hypothetical protein
MTEVVRTRTVHATVGQIWAVLADYGAISVWAPNVSHSSLTTAAADGVGATRRVQVGRNALLEEVVDWQPEVTLSYDISGLPKIIRSANNRWSLLGRGDVTEVTLTSNVEVGNRPPQKLVARIAARQLAKASEQLLDGLATRSEGTNHE